MNRRRILFPMVLHPANSPRRHYRLARERYRGEQLPIAQESWPAVASLMVQALLLQQEHARLRKEHEQLRQSAGRLKGELEDQRRRARNDLERRVQQERETVVQSILPVLDNLERALSSIKTSEDFDTLAHGVELIYQEFMRVLGSFGVQKLEVEGKPFDPKFHEAVSVREIPGLEDNQIAEVIRTGYVINERVLRPALVTVNKKSSD
jgi:molecular chaperone GrpE